MVLTGCNDLIEKNITENIPELILPTINDTIIQNPVQFKWKELDGAKSYHIEIVTPSFSNPDAFVVDSIVPLTSISFPLDTNLYEVRITALNAGYTSKPSAIHKFVVGVSPSFTGNVQLSLPANASYFNLTNFEGFFDWESVVNLKNFTFQLYQGSNFSGTLVANKNQLETSQYYLENGIILSEGTYCWGVKAFKIDNSETDFSKRIFYIDTTRPLLPMLSSPANGVFVNKGDVNFSWQSIPDNGLIQSPVSYEIEIASDVNFTLDLKKQTTSASTTLFNLNVGTYYWRIRSVDAASNKSVYSSAVQFNVSP